MDAGTYPSRFTSIYNAVHAVIPSITVIASTSKASCLPSPLPSDVWTDTHHYLILKGFVAQFNEWDNKPRDGHGVFAGEYASTTDNRGATTYWSRIQGAVSVAVCMVCMERNSDVVTIAGLSADPGPLTGSATYYVQQLFSVHRGDTTGLFYVKLANYGTASQDVTVKILGATGASANTNLVTFTGPATASNYPLNVTSKPVSSAFTGSATGGWTSSTTGFGIAILTVIT